MADSADIFDKTKRLVERLAPSAVCGPCVAKRIEGADLDAVTLVLSELAASREFERDNCDCGLCGTRSLAIFKRG